MPAKPEWLLRLPEILAELCLLEVPVLDRAVIQRLFNFQRRRAILFMHAQGGYLAGHSFLVDRMRLIAQLEVLLTGDGFHQESRRRVRLEEALDKARRCNAARRVKIPVAPGTSNLRLNTLAPGIELSPGTLRVEFREAKELLQRLFELVQAAANDFERFESAVSMRE